MPHVPRQNKALSGLSLLKTGRTLQIGKIELQNLHGTDEAPSNGNPVLTAQVVYLYVGSTLKFISCESLHLPLLQNEILRCFSGGIQSYQHIAGALDRYPRP